MKKLFTIISLTLLLSGSCRAMQMQQEAEEKDNLVGAVIESTFSLIGSLISAPFKLVGFVWEGLMADPGTPDDPHDPEKEAKDRNAIFGRLEMERRNRNLRTARDMTERGCKLNSAHMNALACASASASSRFPERTGRPSMLRRSAFKVARNDINASRKQLDTSYRLPATRKNLD